MTLNLQDDIERVIRAEHGDPFSVLGPHPIVGNGQSSVIVRAFVPDAVDVSVVMDGGDSRPMTRVHPDGFFEATLSPASQGRPYRLKVIGSVGWCDRPA